MPSIDRFFRRAMAARPALGASVFLAAAVASPAAGQNSFLAGLCPPLLRFFCRWRRLRWPLPPLIPRLLRAMPCRSSEFASMASLVGRCASSVSLWRTTPHSLTRAPRCCCVARCPRHARRTPLSLPLSLCRCVNHGENGMNHGSMTF